MTSKAIYGYTTDNNSDWVIDEISAEVVKKIFDMYVNGNGLQMIARYLTQNKIPLRVHIRAVRRLLTGVTVLSEIFYQSRSIVAIR